MKYLQNRWTDLRQINMEDVVGLSLGQVWMSRSKVKGQCHRDKNDILALSATCVRFMFGKTSLASGFWATVFWNCSPYVIIPLSVCLFLLSCLSALSVTLVYCGQTVGWIKMKLGTKVGLGPGHSVLDGDPALPEKRAQLPTNFWPMSIVVKRLDGWRCHLVRR